MIKSYSPQDFRRALATSTLDDLPALEGMAKADEHDEGVLLFSAAGCERWTPVPLELVLQVEHLGSTRCKDHEHPRVRIHLKHPETPEARMLAGLLAAHATALRASSFQRTAFCEKHCAACERCDDSNCEECQICVACSSPVDTDRSRRSRRATRGEDDCHFECSDDYQSCLQTCDPRDGGCFYGCKRTLVKCLQRCR
jgi:hypothetical protein